MTSRYRVGRSCDQVAGAPSGHSPGFRLNGALPIKSKERWPGKTGQWAKWIFCLTAAKVAA